MGRGQAHEIESESAHGRCFIHDRIFYSGSDVMWDTSRDPRHG